MKENWQAFAELARVAPNGHTRWHSICAFVATRDEALQRARDCLAGHLRYDRGGAVIHARIALVQQASRLSNACEDEMPKDAEYVELAVTANDVPADDENAHRGGVP